MIAGEMFLSTIVSVALFVTAVSPVVLIVLLVKDWVRKRLW